MGNVAEIEAAILKLPASEVEELARWLEAYRARPTEAGAVKDWVKRASGAARPGITTDEILSQTRDAE